MKAILHKTGEDFILKDEEGETLAITFEGGNKSGRTLSLKNCQAIERGYDLDEILEEHFKTTSFGEQGKQEPYRLFKEGFQKAFEILGDKKFSERDIIKFMQFIISNEDLENTSSVSPTTAKHYIDLFTPLLKKKEWNVEVEMYISENYVETDIPKLDENNCLILKRL